MRAVVLVLAAFRNLRDLLAIAVGFGVVALVASHCAGCGGAVAVKPILGTACAASRVACRLIDQACDVADGSSGSEAP